MWSGIHRLISVRDYVNTVIICNIMKLNYYCCIHNAENRKRPYFKL